jgi:hypothetical protein
MPLGGEVKHETLHLYCADPTDGKAKFPIATPTALSSHPQASERRTSLGMITLSVDETAPPLHERLELKVALDDDLVLSVEASSSQKHDRVKESYYDLEFGLGLPALAVPAGAAANPKSSEESIAVPQAGLVVRANVARDKDQATVPGDVLYLHNSGAFARHVRDGATQAQVLEHLYYQPCAVCKRQWGHPECRCGSA